MKKTISMLLAVLMAAIAVCTFGVSAFADETTVAANDDPTDAFVTAAPTAAPTEAPTTAPATEAPTTAPATEAPATTAGSTEEATTNVLDGIIGGILGTTDASQLQEDLDNTPTVTRDPSQTYIDEGDTTAAAAPATTKKPAKVESNIPSTGSTVVPVIALLALAAGTAAVVKTKKED